MNPLPPGIFAPHPFTSGHVDQQSGLEATHTSGSARPPALPLPGYVQVGYLTLHVGRPLTALSEAQASLLHSALHANTLKEPCTDLPVTGSLYSYLINATQNVDRSHLTQQPLERMMVSCEFDHAMNIRQMFVGSIQGKIYCQAYFEVAAMADQALNPERMAASRGGPQRTNLALFTQGTQSLGKPSVRPTHATHAARTQPFLNVEALGKRAVGKRRNPTNVKDAQISMHLYRDNDTVRTNSEARDALRKAGLKVADKHLRQLIRDAGGKTNRPGAPEEEIIKRLYHKGALRTRDEVLQALYADGFGARGTRVTQLLNKARGTTPRSEATASQIRAHLYNIDVLRSGDEVLKALHAHNLAAGEGRVLAELAIAKEAQRLADGEKG
jgi:hypothetical protein